MRSDISAIIASTVTATILDTKFSEANAYFFDFGQRVNVKVTLQEVRPNTYSLNASVTVNQVTESILNCFYNMSMGGLDERLNLITEASLEAVCNYKALRKVTKEAERKRYDEIING
jgi:hypothetical protein